MSWRTIAAVLTVIFLISLIQSAMADPLTMLASAFSDTGTYGFAGLDGNAYITGLPSTWFNMGLVAMFGLMVWGLARVVRQELTRGGGL